MAFVKTVKTSSFHCRWYRTIRSYWGLNPDSLPKSICPYFQQIVWLTVAAVLLCIPAVIGLCMVKCGRFLYRIAEAAGWHRLVDALDDTPLIDALDKAAAAVEENKLLATGLSVFITACAATALGGATVAVLMVGIGRYESVFFAICCPGWCVIQGLGLIGAVIVHLWAWVLSVLTSVTFWTTLGHFGAWAGTIFAIMAVCAFVIYKVFQLEFVSIKLNGFSEARAQSIARKVETRIIDEAPRPPSVVWKAICAVCGKIYGVWSVIRDAIYYFFVSKVEYHHDGKANVILSPMAIVWEFLVAFKKGVCPMLQFIDDEKQETV